MKYTLGGELGEIVRVWAERLPCPAVGPLNETSRGMAPSARIGVAELATQRPVK